MTGVADEVRELLARFNTADLADRLVRLGIRGRTGDTCECPIARLIRSQVPAAADPGLWGDEPGQFAVGIARVQTPEGSVPMPPRVVSFVAAFDMGMLGELRDVGV